MGKPTPPNMRSDIGAACELTVCADLLQRGFAVYRNVSQAGVTDIVALKGEWVLRVQVKRNNRGSQHEREMNDVIAMCPDGSNIRYLVTNPEWKDEFCSTEVDTAPLHAAMRAVEAAIPMRVL